LKVKVLKEASNEFEIEIEGAGHSLCNLLQKQLLEDENVDLAGYNLPHPLVSSPIVYVRTKGKVKSKTTLVRAVERTRGVIKDFSKAFEKALKQT